jgi:hypothetical protein
VVLWAGPGAGSQHTALGVDCVALWAGPGAAG